MTTKTGKTHTTQTFTGKPANTEFDKFKSMASKVVGVPKKDIDAARKKG